MSARAPIRESQAMISGMAPVLGPGAWVFCTTDDTEMAARLKTLSLASFAEAEGTSLILSAAQASSNGFDISLPMAQITLTVHSALDGVGLTAAVSTALADEGIPCNMVAGYHHDHVFVPLDQAHDALEVLAALAQGAAT